jgi:transcriptional regulator with XRE-family HTH domain
MTNQSLSFFMKRLRLDNNDETMTEMAKRLKISVSYLSSIENEKRNLTDEMFAQISQVYNLTEKEQSELNYLRNLSGSKLNIKLDNLTPSTKKTTVKFLSNVDTLSESDLERINKIINKKGK